MKDIFKNPTLYYILAPAVLTLWPLLVWAVYLPQAKRTLDSDISKFSEARETVDRILTLDPERSELVDAKTGTVEFDYANEIYRIAGSCGIPQSNCKLRTGLLIKKSGGQRSQSANVTLENISVTELARFLSKIQSRWANLQCTEVKLTQKTAVRDKWDVKLKFTYYY